MEINFILEKNRGHTPSSLVRGQARGRILAVYKILKFNNFNSKVYLGCMNGFIMLISSNQ